MPFNRISRLRDNPVLRELVSETKLLPKDLIMPYFVIEGRNKKEPLKSMPGIARLSTDNLIKDIEEAKTLGIKAVLLFGVCDKKNKRGSESYKEDGLVQRAVKEIKKKLKDIVIITDVCLCAYTSHGHCGIVKKSKIKNQKSKLQFKIKNYEIDNDKTIRILSKIALSHATAGADFVAPSAMMDGQVAAIRTALDKNGFQRTGILAYSAKYASSFYAPFREALGSAPRFGDRKSYQMDYRNSAEAIREVEEDIAEGADIIMVKPALAYLDVIYKVKDRFNIPIAAYNVSGEYAIIKGNEEEKNLVLEILTGIKRAGADLIITYHAKEAARWLK